MFFRRSYIKYQPVSIKQLPKNHSTVEFGGILVHEQKLSGNFVTKIGQLKSVN